MVPTVAYDVDGTNVQRTAVNVLKRVKLRADALTDGAIFYNYQMQEGDTPEIIADKYYGSAQYHWVVMLMNNIVDHTYDFSLSDANFESYINKEYGSYIRAVGVSINLADPKYDSVSIGPNWYDIEQHMRGNFNGPCANSGITSGTFPAGNTTAITIFDQIDSDPFKDIDVGDVVHVFVPERWYEDQSTTTHSGTLEIDSSTNSHLFLQANTASEITNIYVGGMIEITGEGTGTTGITGNVRTINAYSTSSHQITVTVPFDDTPTDEWTYTLTYFTPDNYKKLGYTTPSKVLSKSVYKTGSVDSSGEWFPDTQNETRYFQLNTNLNSNTFDPLTWDSSEVVYIQTGIHHFEMDLYNEDQTYKIANNLVISQKQYVNTSFGVASNKRIIDNYTYESEKNESKRVIQLLKKDYLLDFVDEFEILMKQGL